MVSALRDEVCAALDVKPADVRFPAFEPLVGSVLLGQETEGGRMENLFERLRESFGRIPDPHYFDGDMDYIRAYHDFRRDRGLDAFLLDGKGIMIIRTDETEKAREVIKSQGLPYLCEKDFIR